MERFYKSLRPGDLIYIRAVVNMEGRLALCRILRIKRDESRPDYFMYACRIVQQWFPDYGPIRWLGKRLTVGCSAKLVFPGMWQLYSVQEFESSHPAVRERRIAREEIRRKRKETGYRIAKRLAALAVILFVLYVLISVVRSVF